MKNARILLFAIVGIMGAHTAFSQAEVALGLKGGINLSSINSGSGGSSAITSTYDSRSGYHFGAYALFKFTKIGIQPEILFSKQGHEVTFNSQKLTSNYNYIAIPVILKFYLVGGLNLQAGVQIGFLGSATGDTFTTTPPGYVTSNVALASFMKSTDYSIPVGLGLDLPFGLNFTARYNIGLNDINERTGVINPAVVSSLGTSESKNQVFQFSIGYRLFKLGS